MTDFCIATTYALFRNHPLCVENELTACLLGKATKGFGNITCDTVWEKQVGHKVAGRLQQLMECRRSIPAQREATAHSNIHQMMCLAGSRPLQTKGRETLIQERPNIMRVVRSSSLDRAEGK